MKNLDIFLSRSAYYEVSHKRENVAGKNWPRFPNFPSFLFKISVSTNTLRYEEFFLCPKILI